MSAFGIETPEPAAPPGRPRPLTAVCSEILQLKPLQILQQPRQARRASESVKKGGLKKKKKNL